MSRKPERTLGPERAPERAPEPIPGQVPGRVPAESALTTQVLVPRRGPRQRVRPTRLPIDLRPRGVGEILDAGWRLFASRFGAALTIGFCTWLPVGLLQNTALVSASENPSDMMDLWVSSGLASLAAFVANIVVLALFAPLAEAELAGRWVSLGDATRRALPRLPALTVLAVASGFASTVGMFLCLAPGILLLWGLAVAPMVLVLEGVGPLQAASRSTLLVRGSFWRWVGWSLVFQAMVLPLSSVPSALVSPDVRPVVEEFLGLGGGAADLLLTLLSALFLGVVSALTASVTAVYYLDCRVRHEALDLEVRLERLVAEAGS